MDGWMDGYIDSWMNGLLDGYKRQGDEWIDRWTYS